MAKYGNKIQVTTDYEKLRPLAGNRRLNQLHVKRLVQSFRECYLLSPVLVNEKFEVIDGQHRVQAAKELGLPIYYIMVYGYGLHEVQVLNTNSSDWGKKEYLESYVAIGVEPYVQMKKFMEDFPEFGIKAAEQILTNSVGGVNNHNSIYSENSKAKTFEEGKLNIPNLKKSYAIANDIMKVKQYYEGYTRSTFVGAIIGLLKLKQYDHSEFLHKLSINPAALTDCSKTTEYRALIEDIYNFKRRDKVNLRF